MCSHTKYGWIVETVLNFIKDFTDGILGGVTLYKHCHRKFFCFFLIYDLQKNNKVIFNSLFLYTYWRMLIWLFKHFCSTELNNRSALPCQMYTGTFVLSYNEINYMHFLLKEYSSKYIKAKMDFWKRFLILYFTN